jgi:RNA-binding protein with serine-rich domain 1
MGSSKISNNKDRYNNKFVRKNSKSSSRSKNNFVKHNHHTYLEEYIHIDNLSPNVTENHLREIFSTFGNVNSLIVCKNILQKDRTISALIKYEERREIETAEKCMNNGQIDGLYIKVTSLKLKNDQVNLMINGQQQTNSKSLKITNINSSKRLKSRSPERQIKRITQQKSEDRKDYYRKDKSYKKNYKDDARSWENKRNMKSGEKKFNKEKRNNKEKRSESSSNSLESYSSSSSRSNSSSSSSSSSNSSSSSY